MVEKNEQVLDSNVVIDPMWPINVTMQINSMPYQTLGTINPVLRKPYTNPAFKKVISKVEQESQQLEKNLIPPSKVLEMSMLSVEDGPYSESRVRTLKGAGMQTQPPHASSCDKECLSNSPRA